MQPQEVKNSILLRIKTVLIRLVTLGNGNKKRFMLRVRLWMRVDQFLTPFAVHLLKIAIHICPNVFHYGQYTLNGRFYSRDALPVWTSFGKHFVIRPVIRL